MGLADEWRSVVNAGTADLVIETRKAVGEELELQRPASSAFSMLEFDNPRDKMNFKMFCTYCHQVGTLGFRTPEKPVDWQTMIRRMDGFGGLYPHTQQTIVDRLRETYSEEGVAKWPEFIPPPAPMGAAAAAEITMWELDELHQGSFHDLTAWLRKAGAVLLQSYNASLGNTGTVAMLQDTECKSFSTFLVSAARNA